MPDVIIKESLLSKIFVDNLEEILKDVLTAYDSPVKKMLQDVDSEFNKTLTKVATDTFKEVVKSPDFQEQLKQKFLELAVENMVKR